MRKILLALMLIPLAVGCKSDRFVLKTRVETRLDATPVNPSAGPVMPVAVQPRQQTGSRAELCPDRTTPQVAVIDVDGLLLNTPFVGPLSVGENPVALFREKLDAAAADKRVKAVVLRINSHGGGVAACISMRHDLQRFKECTHLPVVACLMDTATGGAYYLASGADTVVAGPATVTGGVGVIINLFNLRDLMAQFNIIPQSVKTGEFTDMGTSARTLTEGEKKLFQAMTDEFHAQLVADIKAARPTAGPTAFDGRIFTGAQAQSAGLVDCIGNLDSAILMAAQAGGICGNECKRPGVVMYRRNNDPARSIYSTTANIPLQGAGLLPNLPGIDRSKMPTFLSMWQPELTMEKLGGK